MTFDIGLHEVCVRVGVLYVITKFSLMDSLPNFLTHGAPLRARELRYHSAIVRNIPISLMVNIFCKISAQKDPTVQRKSRLVTEKIAEIFCLNFWYRL